MVVDFHTHIFPDGIAAKAVGATAKASGLVPYADGTEAGLLRSMRKSDSATSAGSAPSEVGGGVGLSVVLPVATNPQKCESMNRFALALNEKHRNGEKRLLSFAAVHPEAPGAKALVKEVARQGFRGIKLHPDYQGVFFDDARYKAIVEEAESFGLVTVVHAGLDYGFLGEVHCSPQRVLGLVRDVKPKRLVLAHMGGNSLWFDVERTLCGLGLYFDTSFVNKRISREQFVRLVQLNGDDKILFATDSPWNGQAEDLGFVRSLPLPPQSKAKILEGNALGLLGTSGN